MEGTSERASEEKWNETKIENTNAVHDDTSTDSVIKRSNDEQSIREIQGK